MCPAVYITHLCVTRQVRDLMSLSLRQPVRIAADAAAAAPKGLVQEVVRLKVRLCLVCPSAGGRD